MNNQYYVYILQNPKKPLRYRTDKYKLEFEPFYVGKGTGNRSDIHLENVINKNEAHSSKLWAEINLIRSYGKEPVITKLCITRDEDKAYEKESEIINHYGLRYKNGILVNSSYGKAGGWGGEMNPTFDRMTQGTHNFQISNPQTDTPKIKKLRKMILEVDKESDLKESKWLNRTGYSDLRSLKVGVKRVLLRESKLKYKLIGNTIKKV